jgi:hypothetical protein
MSAGNNDMFYSRLPVNEIPLSDLLTEPHLFYPIPGNWYVVITDVKKSTTAIAGGLHETVNLLATGSIVAVLNIAYRAGITLPFFFGGDGATFILPPTLVEPAIDALLKHQSNSKNNFNIELRVGSVPVSDIYQQNQTLRIAKLRISANLDIPIVLGEGLMFAEQLIKSESYRLPPLPKTPGELDLNGMQCRWDRIKPPQNFEEVVTLLVIARDENRQAEAFKAVIDQLDLIYGVPGHRTPISIPKLKLKATLEKIRFEMSVRFQRSKPGFLFFQWIKMLLGYFYFRTRKGQAYLHELVEMSDTLVIDGKINTVISGTAPQRQQLEQALDELESAGLLYYGLYVSKESIMSCYVRSLKRDHIHFIDGAEGGYTRAAGMLKQKLALTTIEAKQKR